LWKWIEEKMGGGSQKKRRMWKNLNKKSMEAFKTFGMICRAVGQCRLAFMCRWLGVWSFEVCRVGWQREGEREREREILLKILSLISDCSYL
jgi:hypothetical protein